MKIAVIEDEPRLAALLKKGLEFEKNKVDLFFDASSAREKLLSTGNSYDLIMLDLMLPDGDGAEVCSDLRMTGIRTPILVLTARDSLADKIDLLDRGADDFVTKPFNFDELSARARALVRRAADEVETETVFGDLRLIPGTRIVHRGRKQISLTGKEFDVLMFLIRNKGRIIGRHELITKIWKHGEDSVTNIVDVHIRNLRKKIDDTYGNKYIQTIHGIGYTIDA